MTSNSSTPNSSHFATKENSPTESPISGASASRFFTSTATVSNSGFYTAKPTYSRLTVLALHFASPASPLSTSIDTTVVTFKPQPAPTMSAEEQIKTIMADQTDLKALIAAQADIQKQLLMRLTTLEKEKEDEKRLADDNITCLTSALNDTQNQL